VIVTSKHVRPNPYRAREFVGFDASGNVWRIYHNERRRSHAETWRVEKIMGGTSFCSRNLSEISDRLANTA